MLQPYSIHRELAEWSVWWKHDQVSIWSWKWNFPLSQQWWQYRLLAITAKTRYTMLKIHMKLNLWWRYDAVKFHCELEFYAVKISLIKGKTRNVIFQGKKELNAILKICSPIHSCNLQVDFSSAYIQSEIMMEAKMSIFITIGSF